MTSSHNATNYGDNDSNNDNDGGNNDDDTFLNTSRKQRNLVVVHVESLVVL